MPDLERCRRCGRPVYTDDHESACKAVHDSPFESTGLRYRDDVDEERECPMCGETYTDYMEHIREECSPGDRQ
jgi:hypothetical protein